MGSRLDGGFGALVERRLLTDPAARASAAGRRGRSGRPGRARSVSSPGSARPRLRAIHASASAGCLAALGAVGQRDRPVALGQARAVGAQHQRHVGVAAAPAGPAGGRAAAAAGCSPAGRRRGPPRRCPVGVVHHHGQVVGGRAVPAPQHQVVHLALDLARAGGPRRPPARGARRASARAAASAVRSRSARCAAGELAAGARVGALGQRPVRGLRRGADLGPRAPARIDAPGRLELASAAR